MSDWILGALGLAVFLVIACFGGRVIELYHGKKYTRPLAPVIRALSGRLEGDSNTIIVEGFRDGRAVSVARSPMTSDSVYSEGERSDAFEITIPNVRGTIDWRVENRKDLRLRRQWRIQCDNERVRQRLEALDLPHALQDVGIDGWLAYDAKGQWLRSRADVSGRPPDETAFLTQLDLLFTLADSNPGDLNFGDVSQASRGA